MPGTKPSGFRLDDELKRDLDKVVEHLKAERPGMRVTRSDAVRVALTAGCEALLRAGTSPVMARTNAAKASLRQAPRTQTRVQQRHR